MFSRPGVEETEENLLRSQEEFLAGRLNPSATVVRASREDQTVSQSAGDKRILSADERDVVTLEGEQFAELIPRKTVVEVYLDTFHKVSKAPLKGYALN